MNFHGRALILLNRPARARTGAERHRPAHAMRRVDGVVRVLGVHDHVDAAVGPPEEDVLVALAGGEAPEQRLRRDDFVVGAVPAGGAEQAQLLGGPA